MGKSNSFNIDGILKNHLWELVAVGIFLLAYVPALIWMWDRWFVHDSYYSHGILVPFVTGYLIWQKRDELAAIPKKSSPWGLPLIVTGALIHMGSSLFRVYFSSAFSMMIVFIGMILYFYGEKVFKKILFPIAFLVFMIPLPLVIITNISFKMKIFAAQIAEIILNKMGIPALREGSMIKMQHAHVVVDDICSGLRSLISLTALGSIFAYWMTSVMWRRILLFLSTIPIAIATNVFRILFLSLIAEIWGPQYADGLTHDISGFLVFALAFVLLYAMGKILE